MFARSWLAHPQLRVLSPLPVDRQDYFTRLSSTSAMISVIKALTSCWRARIVTPRSIPCRFKIFGKPGEVRGSNDFLRRRAHCIKSRLASLNTVQGAFPALFQLRGNQTILRIAGGITAFGKLSFIARLFEFQFHDSLLFDSASAYAFAPPPWLLR